MKIYKALFYGRVSTVRNTQDTSIENQIALGENFLARHPEIVLAESIDTYVERVSGKSDCRPKYIELMVRLSQGDIDFLIIKDLKRLSRSTEVSAQLRNACKKYGFRLILLETGRIYDPNAEENRMLYGFEALINEEVVYRQSTYARIAHQQKMASKKLNKNNEKFGFTWDEKNHDMIINKYEADILIRLFDAYLFQDAGTKELKKILAEYGLYPTTKTINRWLSDTSYIGLYTMNKKGSELAVGSGQKTKYFAIPKEEWVIVERPDLAFINKEIFYLVQRVRESRVTQYNSDKNGVQQSRFKGTHLFSGKIFCSECGNSFLHCWCDRKKTISAYKDSFSLKGKVDEKCMNVSYGKIYETDLEKIALASINGYIKEHKTCFSEIEEAIVTVLKNPPKVIDQRTALEKQLKKKEKEAEKLMNAYLEASGMIKVSLAERYETIAKEIEEIHNEISSKGEADDKIIDFADRLAAIKGRLIELQYLDKLDRKIVDRFINRIEISKEGELKVILNTDAFYIYHMEPWNGKRQTSSKKSAFLCRKWSLKFFHNVDFYCRVLKWSHGGIREVLAQDILIVREIC